MPGAPNFLLDEAEQIVSRLKKRIAEHQARTSSDNHEAQKQAVVHLRRMENSLHRLQLYRDMLKEDSSHRDQTLVAERNSFGKQYKRRWRPSKV
jgi:hypothetical protein